MSCPVCFSKEIIHGGDDHVHNVYCKKCKKTYTVGTYIRNMGGGEMKISEIDKISMREFSKRDINIDGDTLSNDAINIATVGCLQRIASTLETIERHMAYNNGTLEGLTRNYDPNLFRKQPCQVKVERFCVNRLYSK